MRTTKISPWERAVAIIALSMLLYLILSLASCTNNRLDRQFDRDYKKGWSDKEVLLDNGIESVYQAQTDHFGFRVGAYYLYHGKHKEIQYSGQFWGKGTPEKEYDMRPSLAKKLFEELQRPSSHKMAVFLIFVSIDLL